MNLRRPTIGFRDVLTWLVTMPWRFLRWCARSRVRAVLAVLVVFSVLVGGSVEAYGYWSSPRFCKSCHIMEPYHAAWAKSEHRDVACVQCHFEPGLENELHGKWVAIKQLAAVVTGAYSSMPYAEVSDASCMRSGCHTTAELAKPVQFSDRGITFKHAAHLEKMPRGIQLACTSCHNQRLLTTHMEVDRSACFLCHFEQAEASGKRIGECGTCHGPPPQAREVAGQRVDHAAFEQRGMRCAQCHAEMVSGTGAVGLDRCYSCHNEPQQIERFADAGAMHVEHVTKRKMHCSQCHAFIEHRAPNSAPHEHATAVANGACGDCHSGSHGAAQMLYAGRGAPGEETPRPDVMHVLGIDCAGCHAQPAGAAAPPRGASACQPCHADRYDAFVPAVADNLGAMVRHLEQRVTAVQAKMTGDRDSNGGVPREVYRAATAAASGVALVRNGVPIHNPLFAIDVLRGADRNLAEAESGLAIAPPDEQPLGFAAEDCTACHGALPMPGDLVLDGDRKYPHPVHVEKTGLGCADCHQGEAHPPLAPTGDTSCRQCHKEGVKSK